MRARSRGRRGEGLIFTRARAPSWEVIRKAYKPTREDVDFIMEQFDRDRDGTLDFDEFLSFARHLKDPASGVSAGRRAPGWRARAVR